MPLVKSGILRRTVAEWTLRSSTPYTNPFIDVTVDAEFVSPSGKTLSIPGFYDGEGTWRVRFNPGEAGPWRYRVVSRPKDPELLEEGGFEVAPNDVPGFLRATPGEAWGFASESGEPVFLLGDTTYNLFGMAFCGADVASFMRRRKDQGFNLLRVRLPVSAFHPPEGMSEWQTRRTFPWGGSEQSPRFDRFNLEYFHTVDELVGLAEGLGLGLEMIMEAWAFEFPFNSRQIFLPDWEELWLRYLIARYDAYGCVYFWTPLNEYEYYPDGAFFYKPVPGGAVHNKPVADRWAMRTSRWIKGVAQHGHIVAVHNGPVEPPFARRFASDPEAVDAIMFQEWGARDADNGWLATGIEEQIGLSFAGWWGSAVFAEWGYERNPALPLMFPIHEHCGPEHTRRGAWRGAFCGMGIIHGFENSWGPVQLLAEDQPGLVYLLHLKHFFTEVVPFHRLRPAPEVTVDRDYPPGHRPLALASAGHEVVAVYLPAGGSVDLSLPAARQYGAEWFDPRTGESVRSGPAGGAGSLGSAAPRGGGSQPHDWVLVLRSEASPGV